MQEYDARGVRPVSQSFPLPDSASHTGGPLPLSSVEQAAALRLRAGVVAVPALASHVRPALVLAERDSRALLTAAARQDVHVAGSYSASPAGVQVWSGYFDGPDGTPGSSQHLGSIDWSYDTPNKHYVTIYRAMVTQAGVDAGETTLSILARVMGLAGLPVDGARMSMAAAPARDPFKRHFGADGLTPEQRRDLGL